MSIDEHLRRLEDAAWFQQKGAIMDKHVQGAGAVLTLAGQAKWTVPPGHVFAQNQALEVQTKTELSALNLAVAQESLERFLRLMGQEADKEITAALQHVELQKAQLLAALEQEFLEQEFLDAKAFREGQLEDIARLLIHQDLREVILIQSRTAHEIEVQQLKRKIVNSERETFDSERQVIYKKLEVAQVKLRMIPEIKATLEAQRKVLAAEEALVPLYYEKADAEEKLIAALEETIPLLHDKAAAAKELASTIRGMLPYHREILGYRVSLEEERGKAQDETQLQRLTDLSYEANRDEQQDKENAIRLIQVEKSATIAKLEASNADKLAALRKKVAGAEADAVGIVGRNRLAAQEDAAQNRSTTLPRSAEKTAKVREKEVQELAEVAADTKTETTDIAAHAKITATLLHAIS